MRSWLTKIGALCLLLSLVQSASAQIEIERFAPALDADGFFGVQGTRTPGHGMGSYGLFLHYSSSLLRLERAGGDDIVLIEDRSSLALSVEAGIGSRLAFGISSPIVFFQQGESLPLSTKVLPAFPSTDLSAHARYRFLGDTGEKRDGPGVALQLSAALPSGDDGGFGSEEAVRLHAQALADFHLLGAGIGANLGLRHRFEAVTLFDVELRDEMTFGVGLRIPIPPVFPLTGVLEVRGATDFASGATTAVEGELGVMYPADDGVTVGLAIGTGLTGGIGTPGARVIAGFWYAPTDPDTDRDGIPDEDDACPPLPEDLDGHQDADGCPDPDNDNDLVPDLDDLCPNVEALEGRDDDEDGCTDK